MKYKVGDKFLTEVEIIKADDDKTNTSGDLMPYLAKSLASVPCWLSEETLDSLRRYNMTAEEAWEIARRILPIKGGLLSDDFEEIFGSDDCVEIIKNHTPQEAAAKIKAWEESKKIQVGDIVESIYNQNVCFWVTSIQCIESSNYGPRTVMKLSGINGGGDVYAGELAAKWKKTDRHIDIKSVLKQIGGAE